MFKILGAKNRRKNLHKHPGLPFQIRGGPGSFSNAKFLKMTITMTLFFIHLVILQGVSVQNDIFKIMIMVGLSYMLLNHHECFLM